MAGDSVIEFNRVFQEFQDFLAPRLDTYEQAIYLYCLRHTRLVGVGEAVIGFKSARKRMAMGIGEAGKPMSEGTCYKKIQTLAEKGCIGVVDSTRDGTRLRVLLPSEIAGVVVASANAEPPRLEDLDFFEDPKNRDAIFRREQGRCFYCQRKLDASNWLIEHVKSRPDGDNSYRNVVAACRACNNRKGPTDVRDFLRGLYRAGLLSQEELEDRLGALARLEAGDLRPALA
jgi:hypothetical protein